MSIIKVCDRCGAKAAEIFPGQMETHGIAITVYDHNRNPLEGMNCQDVYYCPLCTASFVEWMGMNGSRRRKSTEYEDPGRTGNDGVRKERIGSGCL